MNSQAQVGVGEQGAGVPRVQQIAEAGDSMGVGQRLAPSGEPIALGGRAARPGGDGFGGTGGEPKRQHRPGGLGGPGRLAEGVRLLLEQRQVGVTQLQVQDGVLGRQGRRRLQISEAALP